MQVTGADKFLPDATMAVKEAARKAIFVSAKTHMPVPIPGADMTVQVVVKTRSKGGIDTTGRDCFRVIVTRQKLIDFDENFNLIWDATTGEKI